MKKTLLVLCLFISSFASFAQKQDASLTDRLNTYFKLNIDLKFNELMKYTHSNLFKLASKEQLVEFMEKAFDNEHMKMTIDSI